MYLKQSSFIIVLGMFGIVSNGLSTLPLADKRLCFFTAKLSIEYANCQFGNRIISGLLRRFNLVVKAFRRNLSKPYILPVFVLQTPLRH